MQLGSGGEPSIRVAADGRAAAYVSAPAGLGSNFWAIAEKTERDGTHVLVPSRAINPDLGTGGGDSDISLGTAPDPRTGCLPIAFSGLHNIDALDNFTVATSRDCGRTFSTPNPYATQNTLTDRQWQTFDGAKTNHLIYHLGSGQIALSTSYDGGFTYVSDGASNLNGIVDPLHSYTLPNVKIGPIVTDYSAPIEGQHYPISGDQIHRLYAVFAGSRNATEAARGASIDIAGRYDHMDSVYLATSVDGGLTWTDTLVYQTGPTAKRELDQIFPVLAVDRRGHVYAGWSDGATVQYAASTDRGVHWTKPRTINPKDRSGHRAKNGTANLFPWLAAGAQGNLDVVWYHGKGGNTTGYRNYGSRGATEWTVAFAQLAGADTARPRTVTYSEAITPVFHTGSVCINGLACDIPGTASSGDRSLLDFFQVAIDKQGRANIAYTLTRGGSAFATYTRQNSGMSLLTGKPVPRLPFHLPEE